MKTPKQLEFKERKPTTIIDGNDAVLMNEIIKVLVDAGYSAYIDKKTVKIHSRRLSVHMAITKFIDWI
jgi:hypothetical protein